jgi:hypothetical protein
LGRDGRFSSRNELGTVIVQTFLKSFSVEIRKFWFGFDQEVKKSFDRNWKIRLKKFCITHHPHVGFSSLALLTFLHYILPLPPPSLVKLLRAYYCNLLPNLYSILLCFQNKARERTRVGILVFIFLNKKISSYPKRYMIPAPFKNEIP